MNLGHTGIWSTELRLTNPGEISELAAEPDELASTPANKLIYAQFTD